VKWRKIPSAGPDISQQLAVHICQLLIHNTIVFKSMSQS
jgi:hypothetical protein